MKTANRCRSIPQTFADTLATIKRRLQADKLDLFINVRCDTYLLDVENKADETAKRAKLYEDSGANGLFLLHENLSFVLLPA